MELLRKNKSEILVELLLALALFALVSGATVAVIAGAELGIVRSQQETQALAIAQEGAEAVRLIREDSFNKLTNGSHGLVLNGQRWQLQGSQDQHGDFARQVDVAIAHRNQLGELDDHGEADPDSKLITTRVNWRSNFGTQQTLEIPVLLTNWST